MKHLVDFCTTTALVLAFANATITTAFAKPPVDPAKNATWKAQQVSEETLEGRRVLRFEHDCLKDWGYQGNEKQYFYVIEPKIKGKSNGPLLVCLHSAGGTGETEMPPNVKFVAEAGDDFTGLVPNSGPGLEWWWGWDNIKANPGKYKTALTPVENRVIATVEWVAREYNIDRDRIYMRGISMGGSGTLGIGASHGDVFAALLAGVPAGTFHSMHRLTNAESVIARAGKPGDVPPALVFFSQKDGWSEGTEKWFDLLRDTKMQALTAWGPWGHQNHYEMTNPAAYEFPWLAIRKNQAYPAFANTSSDDNYPGFQSDAPDQNGQTNAYIRWAVVEDQPDRFAIELRLVQQGELSGKVEIPAEAVTDVTPRRLQRFTVKPGQSCRWQIEQSGHYVSSGTITADSLGLLTVPRVKITARPIRLILSD